MPQLPLLAPAVGGGLPGLPVRAASSGAAALADITVSVAPVLGAGSFVYSKTGLAVSAAFSLADAPNGPSSLTLAYPINGDPIVVVGGGRNASVAFAPNGEFVIASISSTPVFSRYSADGTLQGALTTVAAVPALEISVAFSPNGEFVIVYTDFTNGNTIPRFARYNATGVLQGAITTVTAVNASSVNVAFSPNGEFVIAYADNANNPRFARYNAVGVRQGAIATVAAVLVSNISVAFSPNGEFVVAYIDATNGGNPRFARYNATGVLQGAVTTIAAVSAAFTSVAFSPNGEFVVTYQDLTNANPTFARYSATGVLQGAITIVANLSNGPQNVPFVPAPVAFSPNGEFVVTYVDYTNSFSARFARYNAGGVLQGALTPVTTVSVGTTSVAFSPNGNFVIVYTNAPTAYNIYQRQEGLTLFGITTTAGGMPNVRRQGVVTGLPTTPAAKSISFTEGRTASVVNGTAVIF